MRNRNGALKNQWFGKFSHTKHKSVVFHIQVDRTLDKHIHFPGILMIKNKHHKQTLTHISPKRENLACVVAAFIDYMPGNIMCATEISEKNPSHLLFICNCIQGLGKFVPEFSKRAKSSTLLSSCKQQSSKTSPLQESRLRAMVPVSKTSWHRAMSNEIQSFASFSVLSQIRFIL